MPPAVFSPAVAMSATARLALMASCPAASAVLCAPIIRAIAQ